MLKPDLCIESEMILDIKWKLPDGSEYEKKTRHSTK